MTRPATIAKTDLADSPFVRLRALLTKQTVKDCAARLKQSVRQVLPKPQTVRAVGMIGLTVALGVAAGYFAGAALGDDIQPVAASPKLQIMLHAMGMATGAGWGGLVGPPLAAKPEEPMPHIIRSTERTVPLKPALIPRVA